MKKTVRKIIRCKILLTYFTVVFFMIICIPSNGENGKAKSPIKIAIPSEEDYKTDTAFNYSKVDHYALSASSKDEYSIESLSLYLSKSGSSDREKARAIYIWIADRITYDMDSLKARKIPDQSAVEILKKRTGVCQGYANLFYAIAVKMKLDAAIVCGYSKGYGYRPGQKFEESDHAWNSIKIDGKWRLLDVTWGSGAYDKNSNKIVKTNTGFWFLTRPEVLIYTHLPEEQKWTLLSRTVTLTDFEKMANLGQSFFELGFDESKP